jgi:hypothetical protein
MAESHVVSGLVAKRSELSGQLAHHQEAIRQLATSICNIDGAIKLFEPDYDLRTIKAKASRQVNPWFEHGEANRMLMDILRASSTPLSTRQIGEAMIAHKGHTVNGAQEWDAVLKLVLGAAQRLEKKGILKMLGRVDGSGSGAMLWQIA